jgi:hypothetical protein
MGLPLFPLFIATAAASSFYEQPFSDTVRGADSIVRGKVGKSESQWATLPDGSKHLFTYYDVEVTDGLKGKPKTGAPIRVRELGGQKDGVSLQISGTAQFVTGEDIVVMLGDQSELGDNAYPLVGMMMGKFNVEKGADGKEYLKGPGIGSAIHPALRNEHSGNQTQVSLDTLKEVIRTQAAEPAPNKSPVSDEKRPSDSGLLTGKSGPGALPTAPAESESLTPPLSAKHSEGGFKPILLLIGAILGGLWFLKFKKKRR